MIIDKIRRVLIFTIKNNQYAIDIDYLQTIIDVPEIVRIPRGSEMIAGIINHRGTVTTILLLDQ